MTRTSVGLALALAACVSRTPGGPLTAPPTIATPSPDPDLGATSPPASVPCVEVARHVGEVTAARRASAPLMGGSTAVVEEVVRVVGERCELDRWSDAARACIGSTTDPTLDACGGQLTPEQLASVQQAMVAAMTPAGSGPGAPPPADDPVRPPLAADLADYLSDVKGTGTLTALVVTSLGTLRCALFEREAPIAVANFVGLATGKKPWRDPASGEVRTGTPLYQGLSVHRVIPRFMIQTGDPLGTGVGGPGYAFADEIAATLRYDAAGMMSMANSGPGTNGSQFFITVAPAPWLDGQHTIFGRCDDAALLDRLATVARDDGDRPLTPLTLERIIIARHR